MACVPANCSVLTLFQSETPAFCGESGTIPSTSAVALVPLDTEPLVFSVIWFPEIAAIV